MQSYDQSSSCSPLTIPTPLLLPAGSVSSGPALSAPHSIPHFPPYTVCHSCEYPPPPSSLALASPIITYPPPFFLPVSGGVCCQRCFTVCQHNAPHLVPPLLPAGVCCEPQLCSLFQFSWPHYCVNNFHILHDINNYDSTTV